MPGMLLLSDVSLITPPLSVVVLVFQKVPIAL